MRTLVRRSNKRIPIRKKATNTRITEVLHVSALEKLGIPNVSKWLKKSLAKQVANDPSKEYALNEFLTAEAFHKNAHLHPEGELLSTKFLQEFLSALSREGSTLPSELNSLAKKEIHLEKSDTKYTVTKEISQHLYVKTLDIIKQELIARQEDDLTAVENHIALNARRVANRIAKAMRATRSKLITSHNDAVICQLSAKDMFYLEQGISLLPANVQPYSKKCLELLKATAYTPLPPQEDLTERELEQLDKTELVKWISLQLKRKLAKASDAATTKDLETLRALDEYNSYDYHIYSRNSFSHIYKAPDFNTLHITINKALEILHTNPISKLPIYKNKLDEEKAALHKFVAEITTLSREELTFKIPEHFINRIDRDSLNVIKLQMKTQQNNATLVADTLRIKIGVETLIRFVERINDALLGGVREFSCSALERHVLLNSFNRIQDAQLAESAKSIADKFSRFTQLANTKALMVL